MPPLQNAGWIFNLGEEYLSNTDTSSRPLDVLIMAAGLGTRMKSNRAKVLHELGGMPLIAHVARTAKALDPRRILVVVGHQAEEVLIVIPNGSPRERSPVMAYFSPCALSPSSQVSNAST